MTGRARALLARALPRLAETFTYPAEEHLPPGWRERVLCVIKAPATRENLRLLDAWARSEGGKAHWNPLNSTKFVGWADTDTRNYNQIPVRNYRYEIAGCCATAMTLAAHDDAGRLLYPGILGSLQRGAKAAEQIVRDHEAEFAEWGTDVGLLLRVLAESAVR